MEKYPPSVPLDEAMADVFVKRPELAVEMLNLFLEEGAINDVLTVLRQMDMASGRAQQSTLESMLSLATATNLRLAFVPKASA